MTVVMRREQETEKPREVGNVKMEAEAGLLLLKPKNTKDWQSREARRETWDVYLSEPLEKTQLC